MKQMCRILCLLLIAILTSCLLAASAQEALKAEQPLAFNSPDDLWRGVVLQLAYIVVFFLIALWWFKRKDIKS